MKHTEIKRIIPESKAVILFIHGILGTPAQFQLLYPLIPNQISYISLLLPGHGKNVEDFSHASMAQWKKYVESTLQQLAADYDSVFICAHSMGTLFAIESALHFPAKVKGLFLLGVPLRIHLLPSTVYHSLKLVFSNSSASDAATRSFADACSIKLTKKLWKYAGWIPRYLELFKEIHHTTSKISLLNLPCYAVQSKKDELVSMKACRSLTVNPKIRLTVLPASGHFHYDAKDVPALAALFQEACGMILEARDK